MALIIFDLDGVLVDSRDMHFQVVNEALPEQYRITEKEHLAKYDGLSTRQKLEKLTKEKGMPPELYDSVWDLKQMLTFAWLDREVKHNAKLVGLFSHLRCQGHKVVVASNSIRKTVEIFVRRSGLQALTDLIVSNEDVELPKPNPQMYLQAMAKFGVGPKDTYIFEDSLIGRQAAFDTGAHICAVNNSTELTEEYAMASIEGTSKPPLKWVNKRMNVLIPMAGEGSRFAKAGYTFPKPLIEVNGEPMIKVVVDNLNLDANYIFLVRKEHDDKFNISSTLRQIQPGCQIVLVDQLTEGAACTTLLARHLIDNGQPLLVANSDQVLEWDSCAFYHSVNSAIDGAILTFESVHPKWSYVQLDADGNVTRVAEKEVISSHATCGLYHFAKGSDYVRYADQMIAKGTRCGQSFNGQGEFYVAPIYNEAIADGKIIKTFEVARMHGIGTPEDLNSFLANRPSNSGGPSCR